MSRGTYLADGNNMLFKFNVGKVFLYLPTSMIAYLTGN
jgi:hypothetical protein